MPNGPGRIGIGCCMSICAWSGEDIAPISMSAAVIPPLIAFRMCRDLLKVKVKAAPHRRGAGTRQLRFD
jgi:hypothetical protein